MSYREVLKEGPVPEVLDPWQKLERIFINFTAA
jgi:hypothetical protein